MANRFIITYVFNYHSKDILITYKTRRINRSNIIIKSYLSFLNLHLAF